MIEKNRELNDKEQYRRKLYKKLSPLKVIITLHLFHSLPILKLEEYLKERVKELLFIAHPPSTEEEGFTPVYRHYKDGKVLSTHFPEKIKLPRMLLYLKDFAITLFLVFRRREVFDFYITLNPWEILPGVLLKKFGIVKKLIMFTADYLPKDAFDTKIQSMTYHLMDWIAAQNCDHIWNHTPIPQIIREKRGIERLPPSVEVPNGYDFDRIKRKSFEEIERYNLVYFGLLSENKGVHFAIDCLPEIISDLPRTQLTIIGSGPFKGELEKKVKKKGLKEYVSFEGFVEDDEEVEAIMAECAVGIAPFVPKEDNFAYYADPGKVRAYMACGLPVIITKVPKVAYDIQSKRAGITINYNRKEFIQAVEKLLTNDRLYKEHRKNAIEMASKHTWTKIYNHALLQTFSSES